MERQPVVNAGYGTTGTTIVQSAALIGSAQAFSPAVIVKTWWTQISGPNQVTIANPNQLALRSLISIMELMFSNWLHWIVMRIYKRMK